MRMNVKALLWPAVVLATTVHAADPAPVAVEDFTRPPEFRSVRFSPDGNRFAAIVERKGRFVLTVVDPKTQKGQSFAADRGLDIDAFRWLSNDVIDVDSIRLGVRAFDLDPRDFETSFLSVDGKSRFRPLNGGRVLYRVPGSESDVIVETLNSFNSVDLAVFDTLNNERKRVLIDNPPGPRIRRWVLDDKLVPRAGVGYNSGSHKREIWMRDSGAEPWVKALAFDPRTERGYVPVAVDGQGELLVLSNQKTGRDALYRLDRTTKQPGELLVGHDGFDIDRSDLVYAEGSSAPVGVVIDAEKREIYWFDPQRAARQRAVDAALPAGRVNTLTTLRDGKVLVYSYSDTEPGTYYFYDPQARTLSEWISTRPWIRPAQMSKMEVLRYRASDGQAMFGYFTRPVNAPAGPVPLLVWVHGGPSGRDYWGFDPEVQFFASRGYAVFQPNFRGSTGMGDDFETAGFRQWGLRMQDDVTDGVRALVDQGRVDPKRVCIGGGSYGGYAALMGVIRDPDLYRCAIDEAGPTDLIAFVESPVPDYNRRTATYADAEMEDSLRRRIGDVRDATERRRLEETSPRRLATKIKVPVLLMYGTDDWRVPLDHGTAMRDSLQSAGARFEWKSYAGEGHGVWDRQNRNDRFKRLERFLAENLGTASADR